MLRNID